MKNERLFYLELQENADFIKSMIQLFMLCHDIWKNREYKQIIGTDFHYFNLEWRDEYRKYDGDIFEVFIETLGGNLEKQFILFSDFLKWIEKRKNL